MSVFLEHLLDVCSTDRDVVVMLDKTGREESCNAKKSEEKEGFVIELRAHQSLGSFRLSHELKGKVLHLLLPGLRQTPRICNTHE